MHPLARRFPRAAAGHARAAVLGLLVPPGGPHRVHADGGGGGRGGVERPGPLPWHVLELPARLRPGEQVAVAVRTPNVPFHPPASNATPIVLVAAGTGLAPFRGFLQERALRHARGEAAGPALFFFGCDHPEVDFLYREELAAWEREGVVKVLPAFFRQPDGDVTFVQHRLWKEREQVKALLDQGALLFICGDGRLMAPAARETLARIHQEKVGCSSEEALVWLADMEKQGRLGLRRLRVMLKARLSPGSAGPRASGAAGA
ncbi:hypothetical protein ACN28S_20255 [Cystobacter fuscus]